MKLIHTKLVLKQLDKVREVEGDIIEFGVAFGATTFPLATKVKGWSKRIYACDTFAGIPYNDEIKSELRVKKGECCGLSEYQFNMMAIILEVEHIIYTVPGMFEESLSKLEEKTFCFAWIDADVYQATKVAWEFVKDKITIDGIVGFHDYKYSRCPGVKKVVDTIDRNKFKEICTSHNCIFFRRVK